jgi:hypothetical protein
MPARIGRPGRGGTESDESAYTGSVIGFLLTPRGWLFVGLGVLYVAAMIASIARYDYYGRWFLDPSLILDNLSWILSALAVASPLLVPAVVFGRGETGWRQYGAVAAGSILMAIVPAVVAVLEALLVWVIDPASSLYYDLHFLDIYTLASIASIGGPIVIGIGLSRLMAGHVPRPPLPATVAVLVVAAYESGARLWDLKEQADRMRGVEGPWSISQLAWIEAALAGGLLLAVAWLAWVCLSAYRTREKPRLFWALLLLGSGALLAVHVAHVALQALWRIAIDISIVAGVSVGHILDVVTIAAFALIAVTLFRWEPGYPEEEDVEAEAAAGPASETQPTRT